MANMQKIKRGAAFPLLDHYERVGQAERGYRRESIDPARTGENYNLRPRNARAEIERAIHQHEDTSGKRIRKDANVLCDWVVTLPKDCPPDKARDFFEAVANFMDGRYGKSNVLGCYVHMDEEIPHAHIPVLPLRDGKLLSSKVVDRNDLKSFHGDLGKAADKALGFHVSVELDRAKEELRCIREQIREETQNRDGLKAEVKELAETRDGLEESIGKSRRWMTELEALKCRRSSSVSDISIDISKQQWGKTLYEGTITVPEEYADVLCDDIKLGLDDLFEAENMRNGLRDVVGMSWTLTLMDKETGRPRQRINFRIE